MTTITVEPTESGILVSEAGTQDAARRFDSLPPLTAARYLVVESEAASGLRQRETSLLEHIRPHAHSTLVALEAGLGTAYDGEDEPPAMALAAALGVSIIAPEGQFLSCDGALFAFGGDSGWVAYSPLGKKAVYGRRYPEPAWQSHLPSRIDGTVQIPAGLWITTAPSPSHAVRLSEIAVRPQQLLIVVGSPGETAPKYARILDVLRGLPDHTRASAVLVGYGHTSLELDTVRRLAADLQEAVRIAHGVTIAGNFARLEPLREIVTGTFAKESVCTPDGVFELDRWSAPLGLTNENGNTYRLTNDWLVDVVPAGLVLRPVGEPPSDSGDALPIIAETLTVMLRGAGARDLKRVVRPLQMMLHRLGDFAATRLIPGDRAARRLIRDVFPGTWAPTARLALTEDGRIIASDIDEEEIPEVEKQQSEPPSDSDNADHETTAEEEKSETPADAEHVDHEDAEHFVGKHEVVAAPSLASASDATSVPADDQNLEPETTPRAVAEPVVSPEADTTVAPAPGTADDDTSVEALSPVESAALPAPQRSPAPDREPAVTVDQPAAQASASGAIAQPQSAALPTLPSIDPSEALARALRGSTATTELLAGKTFRGSTFDVADAVSGSAGQADTQSSTQMYEAGTRSQGVASAGHPEQSRADAIIAGAVASAEPAVPQQARSTVKQRQRVRTALGSRYDVASRAVSQLLAQQPGMRMSGGDRSTLLTALSVVSVFADDPTARYDIDFHTCLAEGLATLPTTRSIVVRGMSEASTAAKNSILHSPTPFISAPVDGPLTGPMEALIWTTSGRRLDGLMMGTDAANDIILPGHTQLRVLGTADGPIPRLLLAEANVNEENVLSRLHDAAASRDNDPTAIHDERWLGEPLVAI